MNLYIGIDVGTSALKGLLVAGNGKIIKAASAEYPVHYPQNGWSEQNPADWLKAMQSVLAELSYGVESEVKGVSFGGQMHGLVALDKDGKVIRPCILWNDGRTGKQTDFLNNVIGKEKLSALTANIAFAGFTAPKILWVKENEPENFKRIAKIMLPKDFLAYMLTGVFSTDYSDASGTLLLDVKNKRWSEEMCDICGISAGQLPELYESYEVIGKVKPEFNLPNAIVTAGAGDNAAAAIGMGTVHNGDCNISLGTSGTVFIAQDNFAVDKNNALHSFCHADGKWHSMGCILSAASCRKWWLEDILNTDDYSADEKEIENTQIDGLIFLPYLMGERSPHNDVNARGAFIGLSATTTRAQMSRAVMEGVAFALKDCLEVAKQNGFKPNRITVCGGGARSKVWLQILSDVLGLPLTVLSTEQGPAYGAAVLATVGCGEYKSVEEAAEKLVNVKETVISEESSVKIYAQKYETFKKLYPALKGVCL
ncbi:MAG: xylulokinase [Ruminococcus flavefaciens]|nr:xylulokinase [Ruminococcus flavefaciens]